MIEKATTNIWVPLVGNGDKVHSIEKHELEWA